MRTIGWGIIGCGAVTEVKSGPAFQKARGSRLVAVMRRNGALAADYARRHGVPRWYDRAEDLLADPAVDAVYVATPPYAHQAYTLLAAKAGKPVYVEKPIAVSVAEGEAMRQACREAGQPLFVAYYRRMLERFRKIKEIVDSGAIGRPRAVSIALYRPYTPPPPGTVDWRVDPAVAGGGRFVDLASHTLDFLDYTLGPVQEVCGLATNQGGLFAAEDSVGAAFTFAGGVQGAGLWWFTSAASLDRTEILGTRGAVAFATFDDVPVRLTVGTETTELHVPYPAHVQQELIQTVVDELHGAGRCPSTGDTAIRTTWVMERILAAYYGRPLPARPAAWANPPSPPCDTGGDRILPG
jgi:predicted dehydrogenase